MNINYTSQLWTLGWCCAVRCTASCYAPPSYRIDRASDSSDLISVINDQELFIAEMRFELSDAQPIARYCTTRCCTHHYTAPSPNS
ncbi:hypothetical protein RHMOL_Rhmol06G0288700 [Rhododendron molle]|uniref:Uncharacterized protein n=1 Tax=Rhododendron molle TaxID=49168 RepID=A0ACC0NI66_RHOML|nr:hypothetical protein RHMOL_Rhmol06G0288700 [Rhododendron molle]